MLRKRFTSVNERKGSECVFVAKTVASSVETLLGNGKSLKCCQSSGSSILTSSTSKILETIESEHPASFIINSVCQTFHKEFGCGCTTLVCLAGYWAGALQNIADMGVPASVVVAMLNEIAEELENVSKRFCISLATVQKMGLDKSRFHHTKNVSVQDPVKSTCDVSDAFSGRFNDKNTDHIQEDSSNPVNNFDLVAARVTENRVTFTKNKTDYLPDASRDIKYEIKTKSKSQPRQASPYSELRCSSFDRNSSTCKEGDKTVMQDEFDACFDGLTFNEEASRNFERPLSTSSISLPAIKLSSSSSNSDIRKTFIGKKFSTLLDERKLRNSYSESRSCVKTASHSGKAAGTVGPRSNELHVEHANVNVKFSGNHNSESRKNDSVLFGTSGKLSFQRDIGNVVLTDKKIFKKTNVQNVLLRSRHLADVSALHESSSQLQTKNDNVDCSHVNLVLGDCGDEVSVHSNSRITREHDKHKNKQNTFNFEHQPREIEGTYLDIRHRDECWLNFLGRSLAHGKEHEMSLALQILKKQFVSSEKAFNEFSFLLDFIGVQTVFGPSACYSCVLKGVVVKLSKENQFTVVSDCDTPRRRVALVNGDITFSYRHVGFKDPVQVTHTLNKDDFCNSSLNAQNEWMNQIMLVIKSLNLGVVAIHGNVANELRDHLQALGVVVLENLSIRQLEALSKMTETSIVSYLLDFTAHDIGRPVVIKIWNSGWSSGGHSLKSSVVKTSVFGQVNLSPDKEVSKPKSVVYSAVLCGPVQELVDDSELKFWNCVHRLQNVFEDQCVLPGGRDIERLCIKYLEDFKDSKAPEKVLFSRWIQEDFVEFRPLIIEAMCSGLKQFIARTNFNIDTEATDQLPTNSDFVTMEDSKTVFDNFSCKVEGWKRAIRIAKLFLNSNYHIITGL